MSIDISMMLHGHKIIALFIILFIASLKDMHDRIIPDWMSFLIMLISMMPVGLPHPAGILACLPLLIAGVTVGGVGGGDIKIIATTGTILGFEKTFVGLVAAMVTMLLFYLMAIVVKAICRQLNTTGKKESHQKNQSSTDKRNHEAYPMVPFIFVGMLIAIGFG